MVLSRLFGKPGPSSVPPGVRLYAIGDVHGRLDLLNLVVDLMTQDLAAHPARERPVVVLLGDYIDRGPDSRGVIDRVLSLMADPSLEVIALRGNHEQFLLDFLNGRSSTGGAWMTYGGLATLVSYGVSPPALRSNPEGWAAAAEALALAMPDTHRAFIDSTAFNYVCGDYLFVHAGVRPGRSLDRQSPTDMMQIRQPFLRAKQPLAGKVVVYGHTVVNTPTVERWKIGLDTGAFATGRLTLLRLDGEQQDLRTT